MFTLIAIYIEDRRTSWIAPTVKNCFDRNWHLSWLKMLNRKFPSWFSGTYLYFFSLGFVFKQKHNQIRNTSVIVRVTDRLPMSSKRQIDLSLAAASELGMLRDGVGNVRIEAIDLDQLDKLIKYFEGKPHPNLRLRPFYRGIIVPFTKDSFNLIF